MTKVFTNELQLHANMNISIVTLQLKKIYFFQVFPHIGSWDTVAEWLHMATEIWVNIG